MSPIVLYTIISLSATGIVAAIILFVIAQRFKVIEDPRIDMVEEILRAPTAVDADLPAAGILPKHVSV